METIDDILREVDDRAAAMPDAYSGLAEYLSQVRDRLSAAHKREVAESFVHSYIEKCTAHNCVAWHTVADLRRRLAVAEAALEKASDAFRFCIEQCELELGPKMIGKLCDDGRAVEHALAAIREGDANGNVKFSSYTSDGGASASQILEGQENG